MRTLLFTILALIAFGANSILCRMALQRASIDPASFSVIRFLAGAVTLFAVSGFSRPRAGVTAGSWASAVALAVYALPFAFAYTRLSAGTGALILFGSVQVTMLGAALMTGERPKPLQWTGIGMAAVGLIYLVLPGVSAPPLTSAALMITAGVFWAVYSLQGRSAQNPLADTTGNFARACPLIAAASLPFIAQMNIRPVGVVLAATSGSVTSALGYVVWYAALRRLTATRAAIVQVAVPVIAAAGGVMLLGERLSTRLILSAVVILGGIALALTGRER